MRGSKNIDAGKAQADGKSAADAKVDAASKTDAVEPSSQHGQATDMPNDAGRLQEPRPSHVASPAELPVAPPALPVEAEQPLPEVAPQTEDNDAFEDAESSSDAQEGVAGFPPEAERDVTSQAAPAPGPDGLPQPVGVPAPEPVAEPAPGAAFVLAPGAAPAVQHHYVWVPELDTYVVSR